MTGVTIPDCARSPITGPYATAIQCPIQDTPEWSQTTDHWIIESSRHHPFWTQWVIVCVRLDDVAGFPPPVRRFDGATHEILILAINPDHPLTPELVATPGFKMHHLEPVNFADQFTATDDEMRYVCALMAWSVCEGHCAPEPPFGYDSFRQAWLTSIVKTLAHARGEVHCHDRATG